jgi:hypothetical protein
MPALRATQREELLIVTRPCCQVGVETPRQLPRLTAHVVYLADEFRILLEYEIGHGWPSYASETACESSGVLNRRIMILDVICSFARVQHVLVASQVRRGGIALPVIVCNFLDRTHVAIAALQMNRDLHFSATAYGFGAGIFSPGYALFEVRAISCSRASGRGTGLPAS